MNNCAAFPQSTTVPPAGPTPARRPRRAVGALLGTVAMLAMAGANAAPIVVPNGDFSDPANNGSIGGLIGANINNELIGAGPWRGSAYGILGLLAQPTLTIDSSVPAGTISGLLAINVAGLLNNGGSFRQVLGSSYTMGRFYILSADVSTGSVLDLDLLANANVGIGFMANNVNVASSTTTDPTLLNLNLVEGNTWRLRFGFFADIAAAGPIGVRLFNEPQGLAAASLLGSISFGDVQVEERDIGPATTVRIVPREDGAPSEAPVGQPYGGAFIAIVEDEDGDGVPGFEVSIEAPADGASADLTSPTSNDPPGRIISAMTDVDGIVTFDAVANEIAGCFQITVEALDPELTVRQGVFNLRNTSDDPGQNSIFCNGYEP